MASTNRPSKQEPGQFLVSAEESFRGPLPHPATLAYESITPGLANRVVALAESEAIHRRAMESREIGLNETLLQKEFSERRWGQVCAVIVALFLTTAGSYVALKGSAVAAQIVGGVIGSGGVVALVTVFVLGRAFRDSAEPKDKK